MKKYLKNNATIWLNLAMHQHKKGRAVCKKPSCISWVTAHIFHIVPLHQEKHNCWDENLFEEICLWEMVWKMFLWCGSWQTFTTSTAKTLSLHHGTCLPATLLLLQSIYGQTSASKEHAIKKKHPKDWHSKFSRRLIPFCKMHIFKRKDHVLINGQKHCNVRRGGRRTWSSEISSRCINGF